MSSLQEKADELFALLGGHEMRNKKVFRVTFFIGRTTAIEKDGTFSADSLADLRQGFIELGINPANLYIQELQCLAEKTLGDV